MLTSRRSSADARCYSMKAFRAASNRVSIVCAALSASPTHSAPRACANTYAPSRSFISSFSTANFVGLCGWASSMKGYSMTRGAGWNWGIVFFVMKFCYGRIGGIYC